MLCMAFFFDGNDILLYLSIKRAYVGYGRHLTYRYLTLGYRKSGKRPELPPNKDIPGRSARSTV
jgi:hypothetical protein